MCQFKIYYTQDTTGSILQYINLEIAFESSPHRIYKMIKSNTNEPRDHGHTKLRIFHELPMLYPSQHLSWEIQCGFIAMSDVSFLLF